MPARHGAWKRSRSAAVAVFQVGVRRELVKTVGSSVPLRAMAAQGSASSRRGAISESHKTVSGSPWAVRDAGEAKGGHPDRLIENAFDEPGPPAHLDELANSRNGLDHDAPRRRFLAARAVSGGRSHRARSHAGVNPPG